MSRRRIDLTDQLGPFVPAPAPDDAQLALLRAWMPARRWFPVKSGTTTITPWRSFGLADGSDAIVHLLRVEGPEATVTVQVPVVRRPSVTHAVGQEVPPSWIGTLGDGTDLLDACDDPTFWRAWLTLAQWGEADAPPASLDLAGARMLTVEQSNTSILLPAVAGGAILKLFRTVAPGANPDVDVPRALVQVGWDGVPAPLAWLELAGEDEGDVPAGAEPIDLGVLTELVPDASDGFQLACAYATGDLSFAEDAAELGRTVAGMHVALRQALPAAGQTVGLAWLRSELRRRARAAAASASVIAGRLPAIEQFYGLLEAPDEASLLELQHIHGDLHLGQVLRAGDGTWRVLDFEGEPMRPLAERQRPDLPVRDVAGMLRSFDYAAAVGEATSPTWATDAREAFLAGYAEAYPTPDDAFTQTLRDALELDKALYEVVYEAGNRPDWLRIPLGAVDRLLAHGKPPAPDGDEPVPG
ncbi:maltokinase N-terminal cap-like domain-containing protein [Sanguibacter massiliensis]|uniref:maltokinase N-terminal cap-like domain-containing protein n=1 Tax=Sanguibacter massiliensis TaxID=1973217 RepID=UPI0013EC1E0A|nr:aminoglycoside phosphotransferase [Sanguibacter massiliensis]